MDLKIIGLVNKSPKIIGLVKDGKVVTNDSMLRSVLESSLKNGVPLRKPVYEDGIRYQTSKLILVEDKDFIVALRDYLRIKLGVIDVKVVV